MISVIGGLKSRSGCGYERLAPLLMGGGEEGFKAGPGFELRGLALPYFTVVKKKTCLKNELERDAYKLIRRVGRVAGCCIFNGSFYLINEYFNGH